MNATARQQLTDKFWLAHRSGLSADANRLLRLMEQLDAKEYAVASTEDRIIAAYHRLAPARGELVSLAKLRAEVADIAKDEQDRALKALDRARVLNLDPDPNRKALPANASEWAMRIGGEDKHLAWLA